jgi:hypothetical protein
MKKCALYSLLFAMIIFCVTGCGPHYHQVVTQLEPVDEDNLPEINMSQPVSIVAVLNPSVPKTELFYRTGGHHFLCTLDDLTGTAVQNLEDMLKRKKIILDANAGKKLKIAVIAAKIDSGNNLCGYIVTIRVMAGDNLSYDFTGINKGTDWNREKNLSQAINEALLQLFKNEAIMGYLKN